MPETAAEDLDLLVAAARRAGDLALRYHGRNPETWQKAGGSVVSEADIAVERLLAETLRAARPGYDWRSEEETEPVAPGEGRAFIVDPIDGTRDFLAGGKEWTIALAIVEAGRPRTGVVFAPAQDELYTASAKGGAFRNGAPIRASGTVGLAGACFASPRRYARAALEAAGVSMASVRFVPSLAYRLTLAAAGVVDIAIAGPNARDWDLAAADLLVHEAGAVLLDLADRSPTYGTAANIHPALIAGRPALVDEVRALIAGREKGP
jgi:myo-inositol-1(or 4)-monophosphatase